MTPELLTTDDVARRLGVKRETVYAYVSRGLLARDPSSAPRDSRFSAEAVERLAGRARRPDRSGALEVVVDTQLTALDPAGRLHFRGRDAIELARFRTFEQVTALLWDGDAHAPWTLEPAPAKVVARVRRTVPGAAPLDLVPLAVAALGAWDADAADRHPDAVRRTGARLLAGVLDALAAPEASGDASAAARLWRALAPPAAPAPRPAQRAALDAALVLLADHELAASSLAARVAASAWADPYRVVLAGLGALGGSLHGRASLHAEELLAEVGEPRVAYRAIEARLAAGGAVPGFGHRVYRDRDPRADHLLSLLDAVAVDRTAAATTHAVVEAADHLGLPAPNADLALAGLTRALGLRRGAAPTVFAVARLAGLVAHALEEYPHRLRFRPRATYVGPAPG